jgi:hypothetical protein
MWSDCKVFCCLNQNSQNFRISRILAGCINTFIYLDMQNDEKRYSDWSEDEDFVAELDERVRRYEAGIDQGYTWEELEASIEELKKKRAAK